VFSVYFQLMSHLGHVIWSAKEDCEMQQKYI